MSTGGGTTPGPQRSGGGSRRTLMRVVRVGFVVLALGLGVYAIARDLDGFRDALTVVGVGRGLLSLLLVVIGLVVSAEVWRLAVAAVAGSLRPNAARGMFFVSQLGKYLPGGVWTIAAQVEMAGRHGIGRATTAVGGLLFIAYHIASGVLVAVVSLPIAMPGLLVDHPWGIAVLLAVLVGMIPSVLSRAIDLALRILRQPRLPRRLTARDVLPPLGWMLLVWACFGAATYAVAEPVLDAGTRPELLAGATGAFALAWVVGLLVLPAPAGVGAREVAFVFVLTPMLDVTAATSAAVLLRVVHTASDLGLAAVARWVASRARTTELR